MAKALLSKAEVNSTNVGLSDFIQVKARFGRSVNLERDFYSRVSLEGYVLTTTAKYAFERIVGAFEDKTASRAWTLTGPYGSGKSTFALFAAKVLDCNASNESRAAKSLIKEKDFQLWTDLVDSSNILRGQDIVPRPKFHFVADLHSLKDAIQPRA